MSRALRMSAVVFATALAFGCSDSGGDNSSNAVNLTGVVSALFTDADIVAAIHDACLNGPAPGTQCDGTVTDSIGNGDPTEVSPGDVDVDDDNLALLRVVGAVVTPNFDEMYQCWSGTGGNLGCAAPDASFSLPSAGNTKAISLRAVQSVTCTAGGSITTTTTLTATIDETGAEVADKPTTTSSTITANGCVLNGDLFNDGSGDESLTVSGSVTTSETDPNGTATASNPETIIVNGTFGLTTDDGTGTPFWATSVNFRIDVRLNDGGAPVRASGGACAGGSVVLGGSVDQYTDETCSSGSYIDLFEYAFNDYLG